MLSPARRRGRRRLRFIALVLIAVAGAGAAAAATLWTDSDADSSMVQTTVRTQAAVGPVLLAERQTGHLLTPVQDAAAASLGGDRAMLLGGLTAADTSRADIRIVTRSGDRSAGMLPAALHDTAAVSAAT